LAIDLLNELQSICNLDKNSLHASVRQCAPPSNLSCTSFFSFHRLAVYLKVMMFEWFIFLTLLDPCIMMSAWRYNWIVVKTSMLLSV